MKEANKPIRMSAHQAAMELGVTTDKVKKGLKINQIAPGKDTKYSLKDIVTAMSSRSGLEQKAKDSKYHKQIEEAEQAKLDRLERRDALIPLEKLMVYAEDVMTKCVSAIRHMPASQKDRDQAIAILRATEFNPTKTTGKNGQG